MIHRDIRTLATWVILASALGVSVAQADGPGFEIDSTLQSAPLVTVLSKEGATVTSFASADRANRPIDPIRKIVVRYSDHALWAADMAARTFQETNTSAKFEANGSILKHLMQAAPEEAGQHEVRYSIALRSLAMKDSIDGFPIAPVELSAGGLTWRLWVATTLPKLPADMASGLRQLIPVNVNPQQSGPAIDALTEFPVVRSEVLVDKQWKRILDTQSVHAVTVRSADLTTPPDFSPMAPPAGSGRRGLPPGGFDIPANALRGPGPVMSHPEIYVVTWGKELNDPANSSRVSFTDIASQAFTKYLDQYDVHSAAVKGVYQRSDLPPRAVGNANFAAISAIVYDVGFKEGTPIFWWEVGGHDPLYAILVSTDEVETGHWGGYHFVAFSLTHAVLPFPASLFAHDAIPWQISLVRPFALQVSPEAQLWRADCGRLSNGMNVEVADANGNLSDFPNAGCANLWALDDATRAAAHEFVEAATDPYVFLGWSDPGQQPFYKRSELSDLCEFNPSENWGQDKTVVGVSMVATYWSNADGACVPSAMPSVSILEPAADAVLSNLNPSLVLRGAASDPIDGPISDLIRWSIDGVPVASPPPNPKVPLTNDLMEATERPVPMPAPGQHTVTALITDLHGLMRSASAKFTVKANIPVAIIDSPINLSSYGTDEHIVLRGSGWAVSPGDIPDSKLRWSSDFKHAGPNPFLVGFGALLDYRIQVLGDHRITLAVDNGAGGQSTAEVLVHITPPTGKPSVRITYPANNAIFPVASGQSQSAPISFKFTVTDASGAPVTAPFTLVSNIDGGLGNGLNVRLHGGSCAPTMHKITLTAKGPNGVWATPDTITIQVGQVC